LAFEGNHRELVVSCGCVGDRKREKAIKGHETTA
jgi:hypothetical protein